MQHNRGIMITGGQVTAEQMVAGHVAKAVKTLQGRPEAGDAWKEIAARLQALEELVRTGPDPEHREEAMAVVSQVAEELQKEKPNRFTLKGLLDSLTQTLHSTTGVALAVGALQTAIHAVIKL